MIIVAALLTTLACQQPATPTTIPPAPQPLIRIPSGIDWSKDPASSSATAPQSGADFLRAQRATPAPPAATPSVVDLFRERNAREAAAKAAEEQSAAVADGQFHCRRWENGTTCGNDEETMRRLEADSEERQRRLDAPN